MNKNKFSKIAESLRQYQRAELKDFQGELGAKPVDQLYVDPLPGDAVLQSVLSGNTTFLLGRKGTGKSTLFAKAQSILRNRKDIISVYVDVKSLYDVIDANEIPEQELESFGISIFAYRSHMLRKIMLGKVISEMLKEISEGCERLNLWDKWTGKKKNYNELQLSLKQIGKKSKEAKLEQIEIPVLQKITRQLRTKKQQEKQQTKSLSSNLSAETSALLNPSLKGEIGGTLADFDKTLDDTDIYNEYSDVVIKSFPFNEILDEIKLLLSESGLLKLFIFFDDFSELRFLDQRLFVDVILSPLNNSSNELINLKIAAYPGRVYYGKIDPGKTDTIALDFSDLYEANEVQEMERFAADYASRLLHKRFSAFGENINHFFDTANLTLEDYMVLMFQSSFNVPRIMGHILHHLYLDRISRDLKINSAAIKLAAKKYHENTIKKYFDRLNRYALEPFENKLDRHNQSQLLGSIVDEAKNVRKRIVNNEVGGRYFQALGSNPPTSHFTVSPELEDVLSALESNFFISRYKTTRNKMGQDVIVYAIFMGLCESERLNWGYPKGREYRNYFVQRCFDFTRSVHHFLSKNQTIKCSNCGHCQPMERRETIEFYKWRCPECPEGICSVVNLSDDFKQEVEKLDKEIMLEQIELDIVNTIYEENKKMRAGEVSSLIDTTHQMVGKRTSKLQEMGLINKTRDDRDGKIRSELTKTCKEIYFE